MLISVFCYDYSFLLSLTIGIFLASGFMEKIAIFFVIVFSFIADLANVNYFFQFSFNSKVVYRAHSKQNKFTRKIKMFYFLFFAHFGFSIRQWMIFKCKAFASKEVEKDDLFFQRSILPVFVHRKKKQ
jgi:hypothetical protein